MILDVKDMWFQVNAKFHTPHAKLDIPHSDRRGQGSSPRPDIKTKYEKYFFGDFLSADFWQKLWE